MTSGPGVVAGPPATRRAGRGGRGPALAGRVCLLAALGVLAAVALVPEPAQVFVEGRPLVAPPVVGLLLLASVVLLGIAAARSRSVAAPAAPAPAGGRGRPRWAVVVVRVLTAVGLAVGAAGWGLASVLAGGPAFVTMAGPGGCHVVVRERTVLTTAWHAFVVPGGLAVVEPVDELRVDDRRRLLGEGRWAAEWAAGTVTVRLEAAELAGTGLVASCP